MAAAAPPATTITGTTAPLDWEFATKELQIVGQAHIAGFKSDRPPIDRFEKTDFICHGCLLPAYDFAIPSVSAASIDPHTKLDTIVGSGHFAWSCLPQFRAYRRKQYPVQFSSIIEKTLALHYGAKEADMIGNQVGRAPTRNELSPYCVIYDTDGRDLYRETEKYDPTRIYAIDIHGTNPKSWKAGWKDGYDFHRFFSIPLHAPDRTKLRIEEVNQTIMVESIQTQSQKLTLTAAQLESWLPQFTIRTPQKLSAFALAAQEKSKKRREDANRERIAKGEPPILIAPDLAPKDPKAIPPVDVLLERLAKQDAMHD